MELNIYEITIEPKHKKREKIIANILNVLSIFFTITAVFFAFFFFYNFEALVYMISSIILTIIVTVLRNKYYNFFDYNYVDNSFRILKVVNNKYRRLVAIFDKSTVNGVGLINGETYKSYIKNSNVRKLYGFNKRDKDNSEIVILLNINGSSVLLFLKYNEKFVSYILRSVGISKFDKSFIEMLKKVN